MEEQLSHTYTTKNGTEVPSVTHILKLIKKKNISRWANGLGFKHINIKEFMNEKAMIGTLFHQRVEKYFKKEPIEPFMLESIENEVNARFQNFLIWVDEAKPEVIYEETPFVNDRYGGTVDLICRMYNNNIILLDFKTSNDIHYSHFLQLGGYLNLIAYNNITLFEDIDGCQIVAFGKNKVHQKMIYKDMMGKYQMAFEDCYNLYMKLDELLKRDWDDTLRDMTIL